jgi:hypothetical protein
MFRNSSKAAQPEVFPVLLIDAGTLGRADDCDQGLSFSGQAMTAAQIARPIDYLPSLPLPECDSRGCLDGLRAEI